MMVGNSEKVMNILTETDESHDGSMEYKTIAVLKSLKDKLNELLMEAVKK